MIDMHCHLLPGADHGPSEFSESLAMAKNLAGLGVTHICVTPHLPWSPVCLDAGAIIERCALLQDGLRQEGLDLALTPSAEHHVSALPDLLLSGGLLCYPRGDTFLMEFALSGLPARVEDLIFRIQVKQKVPVIAHVERYPEIQKDSSVAAKLRDLGCYLLINLSGLAGGWDRKSQKTAKELLRAGLVDAATSDLHDPEGVSAVAKGMAILEKMVGSEGLKRLLVDSPAAITGLRLEAG